MNLQSNKKILFNKTTLLSLKAELVKKQEEVKEKKQQPQHKIENFKPAPSKPVEKDDKLEHKKSFKDSLKQVDTEELEACRKAKSALEKKAELYEHLSDAAGNSELAGRFLVDFKTKKEDEVTQPEKPQEEIKDFVDETSDDFGDNDDWTEFTDCLGRTRKCLKTDLDLYQRRDHQLMKIMLKEHERDVEETETAEPQKDKPFLVQKTHDYLQSLREKWEQKEKELLAKDRDIHYQDLLFDEARIHGVGYYSFSTDEEERNKQMEELNKLRQETMRAQKQAEDTRKKRDDIIAARVKAARARQRARAGLPPEEPKENEKDFTTCLLEFLTQQKNEADSKAKEEEKKKKEELEKERQKLREAYVREWDLGKDGVEDKVKRFREMTQEEYVEQQRSKRIDEFAPPQASSSRKTDYTFDNTGRKVGENTNVPKTWAQVRPKPRTPSPPIITEIDEQRGLYFSSKRDQENSKCNQNPSNSYNQNKRNSPPPKTDYNYRNFVLPQETVPVVDELINIVYTDSKDTNAESNECTNPLDYYDYNKRNSPQRDLNYRNIRRPEETATIVNEFSDSNDTNQKNNKSTIPPDYYNYNRSSSPPPKRDMKYRNFVQPQESADIVNELSDSEDTEDRKRQGNEVEPPMSFDYYTPASKKKKSTVPFKSDINEAFAQGMKSLEHKSSNRQISEKYDFIL